MHLSAKGRALLDKAGKRGLKVMIDGSDIAKGTVALKQARHHRKHGGNAKHATRSAFPLGLAARTAPFDG